MSQTKSVIALSALFAGTFTLATTGLVLANNQWSCWHWDHDVIRTVTAGGNSYWTGIINSEFAGNGTTYDGWDSGTCVTLNPVGSDEIRGESGFYGATGWLGLASIDSYNGSACTIIHATSRSNQSYLDGSSYPESWDRHVTCQEIGHTLGLDHRHGPKNKTCMNDLFGPFPNYDKHDADMVKKITTGGNCD